jgi:hypothetical protein
MKKQKKRLRRGERERETEREEKYVNRERQMRQNGISFL